MEEFIQWIECIEDHRQQSKVRYTVQEIVLIVFCSELCRVDDWESKEIWAEYNLEYLREYLPYENGVPSHDTMQRVMGIISTECIQQAYNQWIEEFEKNQKIDLKRIICIDGKTMRGNKRKGKEQKPNHIVTAWSKEGGYSLGQRTTEEHGNTQTSGYAEYQRQYHHNRCYGDTDCNCGKDQKKTWSLCTCRERKPERIV